MTTDPERPDGPVTGVPMVVCRVCQVEVPDGNFCGLCGAHLTEHRRRGPDWLRLGVFGAAPNENVLRPSLTSSLFPHLPSASRMPFRLGLAMWLTVLVGCAALRLPAALITVGALGLPLLFVLYLRESGAYRDLPVTTLGLTAVLGVAIGVSWVLLTGMQMARSYGVALGSGISGYRILHQGLGIPIGGMLLMLLPAVVVRLIRPGSREALDGFTIGALGTLSFTAAATITRLAPQFSTGVVSGRPLPSLLVEAGIRGVAMPITAAAAGGLLGAALWFTRPANKADQHPWVVRWALAGFTAVVLALFAALGLVDVGRFSQYLQLAMHLGVMLIALLALRVGMHLALLHEAHDPIHADQPLLCPHCRMVVPDMAFCPSCGAATRASSRSSRAARREHRPVRTDSAPDSP